MLLVSILLKLDEEDARSMTDWVSSVYKDRSYNSLIFNFLPKKGRKRVFTIKIQTSQYRISTYKHTSYSNSFRSVTQINPKFISSLTQSSTLTVAVTYGNSEGKKLVSEGYNTLKWRELYYIPRKLFVLKTEHFA